MIYINITRQLLLILINNLFSETASFPTQKADTLNFLRKLFSSTPHLVNPFVKSFLVCEVPHSNHAVNLSGESELLILCWLDYHHNFLPVIKSIKEGNDSIAEASTWMLTSCQPVGAGALLIVPSCEKTSTWSPHCMICTLDDPTIQYLVMIKHWKRTA